MNHLTTKADLQSYLLDQRRIYVNGYIDCDLAETFIQQAHYLALKSKDPVSIHINSVGGNIDDGIAMLDTIKWLKHEGITVFTQCVGRIIGPGIMLLCAGTKGCRSMSLGSHLKIHASTREETLSFTRYECLEELVDCKKYIDSIICSNGNPNIDKKLDTYVECEHPMSFLEALDFGIIDTIVESGDKSKAIHV